MFQGGIYKNRPEIQRRAQQSQGQQGLRLLLFRLLLCMSPLELWFQRSMYTASHLQVGFRCRQRIG